MMMIHRDSNGKQDKLCKIQCLLKMRVATQVVRFHSHSVIQQIRDGVMETHSVKKASHVNRNRDYS
jgi:hypothetical protein